MKRRNADCGKIRRPIKRNKITEGMYGSTTILYLKFLILWAIVITADFMFMFRFEFLWPFWLLLRSVHDSFKYKGLAFSVLFVCIAITSDLVCLFFIPVHWLLFAASTYVWVQYVWHTDKGICLPTIILWMLFVYLEAGIRWKDSRHMPHLDLCRPFAAHCIGYPVVTLGFGFKSYVGYRMRQRKQREVAKENEFYMQLLQQALPQEEADDKQQQQLNDSSASVAATHNNSNSIAADSLSTSSPSSSSVAVDDKNYVQLIGQSPNQPQQNHNNLNSTHNSSSSRSSAQNNSKLSYACTGATPTTTSSLTTTTTTSNGHVPTGKNRRSVDKDKNHSNDYSSSSTVSATNHHHTHNRGSASSSSSSKDNFSSVNQNGGGKMGNNGNYQMNDASHMQKNRDNWDGSCTTKERNHNSSYENANGNCNNNSNNHSSNEHSNGNARKSHVNGNVMHYEIEEVTEPVEKVKGRRNRSKKDASSKDNHHHHHHHHNNSNSNTHTNHNTSHNHNHSNHHHHSSSNNNNNLKDSNSDTSSISSASSTASTLALTNLASQVVSKICESCLKLEADVKRHRTELSHMKQIENELRQKLETNLTNKNCLQAKQKECDDLDRKLQEISNLRQVEFINLQNAERRIREEQRQRQSLEALLNNEKKARKLAEDKANRPECSEACKQRKHQIEAEAKQLRRELKAVEEAKHVAEQQGRKCEHELRMFEAEIRSRDAQPATDMLMSALAVIQDKNSTLEKNLSAETRVKLDLFSALGEAKRQLEIKDSMLRSKQDEVIDLKAKIAQLLAVMPTDSLCLPSCTTTGSSMLRMNDTPPLQGPSSPMLGMGAAAHQQLLAGHSLSSRVQTSVVNTSAACGMTMNTSAPCMTIVSSSSSSAGVGGNITATNNGGQQQTGSNLDPNATAYTPKSADA